MPIKIPDITGLEINITIHKIILTVGSLIIISILTLLLIKLINRKIGNLKRQHIMRKVTFYTALGIVILVISYIWLRNISSLTTIISIIGAGAVLALHQVLINIAGWVLIVIMRPYTIGDRIQVNETKGDVIDISIFWTTLFEVENWVKAEQSTGRIVNCPNSSVFKTQIFNYTKGFQYIWNEITIMLTFESNWQKAEKIIMNIANEMIMDIPEQVEPSIENMSYRYMVRSGVLTPIVYVTIQNNGIHLTLRYLTEVRQRRTREVEISRKILEQFAREDDIHFTYPTYRIYRAEE